MVVAVEADEKKNGVSIFSPSLLDARDGPQRAL